uniref:Retrotransposon gag domain-containing protein n=1 Tax=Cajanus cajan TaxID=3821 RepID=A0A151RIR0_CAJCA|nr:hypothetical protein KK1_036174 [Cajanus cajan]
MLTRHDSFHSWVAFTRALELEFGPSPYECPRSHLFKLTQTDYVHNYYVQFIALANCVQGITTEALLDCFIGGLKSDIRRDVIAQSPSTLIRSVSLAKLYKEKYLSKPEHYQAYPAAKTQATNTSLPISQTIKSTSFPPLLPNPTSPTTTTIRNTNIKKITPVEMQLRREKGLCYTCDEKFSPSHRCPNKQYLLLQLQDEDCGELQPEPLDIEHSTELHLYQEHHLSYNALKGASGLGTMKFQGSVNGITVQVLLDSGSSDNFLQPRIAHCLKFPIEPIPNFQVLLGMGADLVLGAAWLATLGPHISDYSNLTLKFYLGNQFVTLHGEQPTLPVQAQYNHMRRMNHTHAIAELFTLQFQQPDCPQDQWLDLPTDMELELVVLLHTYRVVFSVPSGRFIKQYAVVSAPLTNLLKKDNFKWDDSGHGSFAALKTTVTQAPVLALPNFCKPFVLEMDASGVGIGVVLKQQKWLHKLLGYDFTIEYKHGKDNIVAYSLSKSYFMAWSQPNLQIFPALREAVFKDIQLKAVLDLCLLNKPPNPHYSVHDNFLFWKGRLVIPKSHDLVN